MTPTAEDCTRRTMIRSAAAAATIMGLGAIPAATARPDGGADAQAEDEPRPDTAKTRGIGIVLFDDFETLDVFGPVQMWGRLPDHALAFVSADGRAVRSAQGTKVAADTSFAAAPSFDVLMVPGGMGTRRLVDDAAILGFIREQDRTSRWTTSVCTGAALLARAGVLDGRRATTNKLAFDWVRRQSDKIAWAPRARWVIDGKYVTSSGVSAGTDMALALVERLYDRTTAEAAARIAEYRWNDDPENDPFAVGEA